MTFQLVIYATRRLFQTIYTAILMLSFQVKTFFGKHNEIMLKKKADKRNVMKRAYERLM